MLDGYSHLVVHKNSRKLTVGMCELPVSNCHVFTTKHFERKRGYITTNINIIHGFQILQVKESITISMMTLRRHLPEFVNNYTHTQWPFIPGKTLRQKLVFHFC